MWQTYISLRTDGRGRERKKKLIIHRWNSFGEYHNSPTVISLLLGPGHKTKMKSAAHGSTERKEEEEAAGVWRRRITKISKCISSYKKKKEEMKDRPLHKAQEKEPSGENAQGVYIVTNQKPPSLFQLSDWQVGPPQKSWERERAHYEP